MNAQVNTKEQPGGGPALHTMLQAFPQAKERSNGWWSHEDTPRFDFREREDGSISINSWTGRGVEEILALRNLTRKDISSQGYTNTQTSDRLDLTMLAFAKKIDWRALHAFGLQDGYRYRGYRCVKIPYFQEDGTQHTKIKVRKAVDGKYKHCWDEGTYGELIAYGLHKLDMAHKAGYLLIGEGESDAWACWSHEVPYLGLPGASQAKCLRGVDLSAIAKIYILHEPDQVQKQLSDGQGFYKKVHTALRQEGYTGEIFCIHFKEATQSKDPSDLHIALWNQHQDPEQTHAAFETVLTQALTQALPANDEEARVSSLPSIVVGRQLRELTLDALDALAMAEASNPSFFLQSGTIKRVDRDELYRPVIREVSEGEMRNALTNSANYFRAKISKEGTMAIPIAPPKEVVQSLLSLQPKELPFAPIEGIVQIPVLRPDGSLLDTPGYDEATRLYYMPQHGLDIPPIPTHPTQQQAQESMGVVKDLIAEFPWEAQADRANMLGTMLTTVTRQMFKNVPLGLIDAVKAGIGKGKATNILHIILTALTASAISPDCKDEELNKILTAMLMEGTPIITMDNVEREIRSPILAKILTSEYHTGRILGQSKTVSVAQRAMWIMNGNNLQVGGDIARRSYRMRMVTTVSDPDARENFKYPDLERQVLEHRGEIIAALLTIARAWYVAGCPAPVTKLRKIGSFSHWCDTIGGMLSYAGIEGFLGNIDALRREADVDSAAWARFLELWQETLGNKDLRTAELVDVLKINQELAEALPTEYLATLYAKEDKTFSRVLGRVLAKQNGTPYGPQNLRLIKGEDSHAKVATFHVVGLVVMQGTKAEEAPVEEAPVEHVPVEEAPVEHVPEEAPVLSQVEREVSTHLLHQVLEKATQQGVRLLLWNVDESIYPKKEVTLEEFTRRIKASILVGGKEHRDGNTMMRRLLLS